MGTDPGFWPWWATASSLGATAVLFWLAVRRPFGVSGVLARFAARPAGRTGQRGGAGASPPADGCEAALLAATLEAFGPEAVSAAESRAAPARPGPRRGRALGPQPALGAHALFLAAIVAGGCLSQALRGGWRLQGMGPGFARALGPGWAGLAALAAGGLLAGFGAGLCGGCTSGHGLTGCARLQPGSLAATASFLLAGAFAAHLLHAGLP